MDNINNYENQRNMILVKLEQLLITNLENNYANDIQKFLIDNKSLTIFLQKNNYDPNQHYVNEFDYVNMIKKVLINQIQKRIKIELSSIYNNDVNKFKQENSNIDLFLQKTNIISNNQKIVSNEEYLKILDDCSTKIVTVIPNNNFELIALDQINHNELDEDEQKIRDAAIKAALSSEFSHDLKIVKSNGKLTPYIIDSNGNRVELKVSEINSGNNVKIKKEGIREVLISTEEKGFSNALILAFIIGTLIGIIFLCVYSKIIN